MSKIFKLVQPRGEEAETLQSTSAQPATETDWSLCFMCQEIMQESLICPSQNTEDEKEPELSDYYLLSKTQKQYKLAFMVSRLVLIGWAAFKFLWILSPRVLRAVYRDGATWQKLYEGCMVHSVGGPDACQTSAGTMLRFWHICEWLIRAVIHKTGCTSFICWGGPRRSLWPTRSHSTTPVLTLEHCPSLHQIYLSSGKITSSSCSFNKKFDGLQTKIDVYMEKAQLIKYKR